MSNAATTAATPAADTNAAPKAARGLTDRQRAAAERLFRSIRPELEERFRTLAGRDGKPAGLRWLRCEFSGEPTFARARAVGWTGCWR